MEESSDSLSKKRLVENEHWYVKIDTETILRVRYLVSFLRGEEEKRNEKRMRTLHKLTKRKKKPLERKIY